MSKYRITYVDSCLREAVVDASSPETAEEAVRQQMEHGEHHHAVDAWNDDWAAEPHQRRPVVNRTCFECGRDRD